MNFSNHVQAYFNSIYSLTYDIVLRICSCVLRKGSIFQGSFIALLEILLGLSFLFDLFTRRRHYNLIRLNFKLSMLIFFGFSIFDILFGDRMELWEHGTFLILATIHFVYILLAVPGKDFDKLRESILNISNSSDI